jgi:hypothetical protein
MNVAVRQLPVLYLVHNLTSLSLFSNVYLLINGGVRRSD